MKLLARTDPDLALLTARCRGLSQVDDLDARKLRYENLPTPHLLDAPLHELDRLAHGHPEPTHPLIGDRDAAALSLFEEERNDATAACNDVPVTHAREPRGVGRGVGVALHEELLGTELRRAVEI